MIDIYLLIAWFNPILSEYWIYRRLKGKVWVQIDGKAWSQARWTLKKQGYLSHITKDGIFHKSYKQITKIEDFS